MLERKEWPCTGGTDDAVQLVSWVMRTKKQRDERDDDHNNNKNKNNK